MQVRREDGITCLGENRCGIAEENWINRESGMVWSHPAPSTLQIWHFVSYFIRLPGIGLSAGHLE